MANSNIASGLQPVNDNGTPWSGQGRMVAFAASYASNVFIGDPLVYTGASDPYGVPYVNIATAGSTNTVAGSLVRLQNGPAGSNVTLLQNATLYRQASVLTYAMICDDPNQVYEIQEDSVGGAIAAANSTMQNANLVAGSGSTATALSGWQLQSSSVNTTNTLQLRILGLARGPDNALGVNAKWYVRLNIPQLWNATGA